MGAVSILIPTVIAGWPAISAAASGAAVALGLTLEKVLSEMETQTRSKTSVDIALDNSEVVGRALATGEEMVFTKGLVRARVYRDDRGQCRVCAEGEGYSKADLTAFAESLAGKITQVFVYNKVMTELEGKGFNVVKNEISSDQTVHLHVRRTMN